MSSQYVETLIIGAGQAGLSTGYHLQRRGRPFLIVDANERIGDHWRQQWDTLRLYTPAKYDGLPGLPFPSDRWHFPQKDEVAAFLERYSLHWDLPVRMSTRVERLEPGADGCYIATVGDATISCENVVVATGSFGRTPSVPGFAVDLDPSVKQLHSSEYRRPSQLQPGLVLVVGASHSGTEISHEVAAAHETILCGHDGGQVPVRWGSRRFRLAAPLLVFMVRHVLTRRTPIGRKAMKAVRSHGTLPHARVKRADLAERGVERVLARASGVVDGRPVLDDGRVIDAANVVWCTGFRQVFDWIDMQILGTDGWPIEYRGVVEAAPGLYFCGLSFRFAMSSMVFPGVGRDADYIARHIVSRTRSRVPAAA